MKCLYCDDKGLVVLANYADNTGEVERCDCLQGYYVSHSKTHWYDKNGWQYPKGVVLLFRLENLRIKEIRS